MLLSSSPPAQGHEDVLKRAAALATLLLYLLAPACGSGAESPAAAGARSRRSASLIQPQVLQQATPDFADATQEFLAQPGVRVTVVFRISVASNGTMRSVKILKVVPDDVPVARAFADEVAASIPSWRFRPAILNGKPVDAEFDFTMEVGEDGPAAPRP